MKTWESFYDAHASVYMQNGFSQNTLSEVDFLLEELNLPQGSNILDIGCGTGRHSVELAKRGFQITGVDISSGMLKEAENAARGAGVKVEFIQSDATRFTTSKLFDAAVSLCVGAFGMSNYNDDPEKHNASILRNIHNALKPGSPFVLTTLNAYAKIRDLIQDNVKDDKFDPISMTSISKVATDEGLEIVFKERRYTPPEITHLLQISGFEVEHIWGGTAGNWGRRKIELDEVEVMYVCRKI
ncbi:class I SAM-dependent methyltransferase [Alicyclobacillus fodiniaquatilis]|uniref:Class I SAM-dependent methyltransferase n=1 Tax=Alicyclobacillus fodiniaquatilis TaxID=1661150 RepID=A0ABW4JMD4_9BACL